MDLEFLKGLDVADVESILEHHVLWNHGDSSTETQVNRRHTLRAQIQTLAQGRRFQLSEWDAYLLEDAIEKWQKAKIMEDSVASYFTPQEIEDTIIEIRTLMARRLQMMNIGLRNGYTPEEADEMNELEAKLQAARDDLIYFQIMTLYFSILKGRANGA